MRKLDDKDLQPVFQALHQYFIQQEISPKQFGQLVMGAKGRDGRMIAGVVFTLPNSGSAYMEQLLVAVGEIACVTLEHNKSRDVVLQGLQGIADVLQAAKESTEENMH